HGADQPLLRGLAGAAVRRRDPHRRDARGRAAGTVRAGAHARGSRNLSERVMSTNVEEGLVYVTAGRVTLEGNLLIPGGATGLVMFAHGSGSSRFSSRNRYVADVLRRSGVGTLLIDLLTREE